MSDRIVEAVRAEARLCRNSNDVAEFVAYIVKLAVKVAMEALKPLPAREQMKELFTLAVDQAYDVRLKDAN